MSLLHFDALGHSSLGHPPADLVVLSAFAGAFVYAGAAEAFMVAEAENAGGFFVALGVATVDLIGHPTPPAGGFAFNGIPAGFKVALGPAASAYTLTGIVAGYTRDFINWIRDGFGPMTWSRDAAPAPAWSGTNPPTPSWNNASAPASGWTAAGKPSTTWTVDTAQYIAPPVTQ
jgi:hypothetical protein